MGGFTSSRNHLFNLFPAAFKRKLEEGDTKPCIVMIDAMQFLAGKLKYGNTKEEEERGGFDSKNAATSIKKTVLSYMYSNEYTATKGVVVFLDTTMHVPTNKASTQKKRDTSTIAVKKSVILNEGEFDIYTSQFEMEELSYLLVNDRFVCPIPKDTIWRSSNLKFQLYRIITQVLLEIEVKDGLKLVIDDGIAITDENFRKERKDMIEAYQFQERSEFEKECLVSCLAQYHLTKRITLIGGKKPVYYNSTRIGEADVKFPGYIWPNKFTHSYLIVSQDTDIIFILLLHMKTVLPFDDSIEVWLDTQTPKDRNDGISRPYRFINIKALYYNIITFFNEEYPSIVNPIETLVFLVYSLETDFTSGFDSSLKVTEKVLWETFSELHTPPGKGFVLYNPDMYDDQAKQTQKKTTSKREGLRRSKEGDRTFPGEMHNILSGAVGYSQYITTDLYQITIDDVKCQQFLFFACQLKIINDLALLGNIEFSKKQAMKRHFLLDRNEMYVLATQISEKVSEHANLKKQQMSVLKEKIEINTNNKNPIVLPSASSSSTSFKRPGIALKKTYNLSNLSSSFKSNQADNDEDNMVEDIDDDDDDDCMSSSLCANKKKVYIWQNLDKLASKNITKSYGLPTLRAMLARIYRTELIMNYLQNGSKDPSYADKIFETHEVIKTESKHGWKATEIPQTIESIKRGDFINSYYSCRYTDTSIHGEIPFKIYQVTETDEVYNRNYSAYIH